MHVAQFFPSYTTSPLSHGRARSKLQQQTLQHLLDVLRGLPILDLCNEGTWTATSPHDTAKGIACETRSEPPPSPASLAVGSTPRAKRMCLLALMNVRNATSPCLCFCCTNNRIIIHVQMNQSTKITFARKGGVRIIRVYELLEIIRYIFQILIQLQNSVKINEVS